MVRHLHEGQLCRPLLERLAVDAEAEAARYGGEESLLPRPACRPDTLLYGCTLVGEALCSECAHPRMYGKPRQLHHRFAARRIVVGSQETAVVLHDIRRNVQLHLRRARAVDGHYVGIYHRCHVQHYIVIRRILVVRVHEPVG